MDRDRGLFNGKAVGVLAAQVSSPPEEGIVEGLEKVTALHDEVDDEGAEVLGGDSLVDFVGEEGRLHLEELLQEVGVELGDQGDEVHGGDQGDVEGVEADDGEALDDVVTLLQGLLAQLALSTNQNTVLLSVNQSEHSVNIFLPIRTQY